MTHLAPLAPAVAPTERRRFTIVQDERGLWVAREKRGLIEGVFVDQRAAIRFALYECGRREACSAVIDTHAGSREPATPPAGDPAQPARRRTAG